MPVSRKPLMAQTAGDLMSRDIVRLSVEMPLVEAARLLWRNQVGGAPVVDSLGKCVGVLSAFDFLRLAGKREEDSRLADLQAVDVEKLPGTEVRRFMTPDPVTVRPDTPIRTLARMMIDAHIHRVIVVDEEGKPVGVVSSTDLLAALANCEGEH